MAKATPDNKKLLKELNDELKRLQVELMKAKRREGKDENIEVDLKLNQALFQRVKQIGSADRAVGQYYLEIAITAKESEVFVPVSIASGKKTAGFMYQIEGTAPGAVVSAGATVRGVKVSQVTLGTLTFAKIPAGATAMFQIQVTVRGQFRHRYKIAIYRLNYKLDLAVLRYEQYLKVLSSRNLLFS